MCAVASEKGGIVAENKRRARGHQPRASSPATLPRRRAAGAQAKRSNRRLLLVQFERAQSMIDKTRTVESGPA